MALSTEIFNILKGANLDLRLFDIHGQKTIDDESATRFYAYDEDMLITLRTEDDDSVELVVQAGPDFKYSKHRSMLENIKQTAHNNMAQYNIRKFDKKIAPKDFAQDVVAEGYSRAHGSVKTSYITLPEAKIIIKHTKGVNEEVRGSRSRNIKALYIENAVGERFKFPHRYMQGAKAMAKHVSMGGTPYDEIGESILSMCTEIMECNEFVRHIKSNKLVNEGNENVVEAVRARLTELKSTVRNLQTTKGYSGFEVVAEEKENEKQVDIAQQFLYNTFETADMDAVLSTVARIVKERDNMKDINKAKVVELFSMIKDKEDFSMNIDVNDPEHPDNEDPAKYQGQHGKAAKLSAMLSFLAKASKNDQAFNLLAHISTAVHDLPQDQLKLVRNMVDYLADLAPAATEQQASENIAESATTTLRKKIAFTNTKK